MDLQTVAWKKLKIKCGVKAMNLTSDRSTRCPDSNGVNDTLIRVWMTEIEAIKVGLTF